MIFKINTIRKPIIQGIRVSAIFGIKESKKAFKQLNMETF